MKKGKRGFISIILVVALIPFLLNDLKISNDTQIMTMSSKNNLILHQRINEEKYRIERGFENAVRRGMEKAELAQIDEDFFEKVAPIIVCNEIRNFNENFSVGVINTDDCYKYDSYSTDLYILADSFVKLIKEEWPEFLSGLNDPCVKFISVDKTEAVVGVNKYIDFAVDVTGFKYDTGFIFKTKVMENQVTVVIPEGRVIK